MTQENMAAPSSTSHQQRITFTLPPFWPEQPAAWFAQIEGQFVLNGVTEDSKKYYLVTGSLDFRYVSEVLDIIVSPPAENKYEKLKKELIERLSTSQEKKTRQLLEFEELGDRKPSQFLRHLRGLAGNTMPDDLLRTIWISRLPGYVQAILATVAAQPLDDAARLADQCVSNYKPLYDKTDVGYKSVLQKENCWQSVARSLLTDVPTVKARFKALREKYRREVLLEDKLARSGASSSTRPTWSLMSFFKFMNSSGETRQTVSNCSEVVESYEQLEDHNYSVEIDVTSDENSPSTPNSPSTHKELRTKRKKKIAMKAMQLMMYYRK